MLSKLSFHAWSRLYMLLAASYLVGLIWLPYPFAFLYKASPILILAAWGYVSMTGIGRILLVSAVLFSACGDILLALPLANGFLYGLGAFLIAHLFYLANFSRYFAWRHHLLPLVLLLLISVAVLLNKLLPMLGDLTIPVLLYISVITLMALMAICANAGNNPTNHKLLIAGAGCFVISDGLIAWNKFISVLPYESLLVMGSYYLAQWCIVKACITMSLKQRETTRFATTH